MTCDYIIIEAGSAGCTLAGRLSENPDLRQRCLQLAPLVDTAGSTCRSSHLSTARKGGGRLVVDQRHGVSSRTPFCTNMVTVPMAPTGRRFIIANHGLVPNALPVNLKPVARRLALARKAIRTLYAELGSLQHSAGQLGSVRRTIDAPVVVLSRSPRRAAGEGHDRVDETWLDLQRDLARTIGNSSVQVVPGSGHYIHLDRPNRVVDAIRTIVRTNRMGRTPSADRRCASRPGPRPFPSVRQHR